MVPKVAYITSAAKGLGHATVKALLRAGWNVSFTYGNSEQEALALEAYAKSLGRMATGSVVDLMDKDEVITSVRRCQAEFGRIDALIHNFGPFVFDRYLLSEYSDDMWSDMIQGNLSNFFWMYREIITGMRQQAFGRIVTVGYDGAGQAAGWRFRAAYAAAKSGLAALTRSIAKEERQNGVTANMVCPGDIRGEHKMAMIDEVIQSDDPLGRPPVGEDIARLIVHLCQRDSQEISGTVTGVTGGYDVVATGDDKYPVREPQRFAAGETVWVYPWQAEGQIRDVRTADHRYNTYGIAADDGRQGRFTAFQLARTDR